MTGEGQRREAVERDGGEGFLDATTAYIMPLLDM